MDVCLTSPYGFHDITIVEKQEKHPGFCIKYMDVCKTSHYGFHGI